MMAILATTLDNAVAQKTQDMIPGLNSLMRSPIELSWRESEAARSKLFIKKHGRR
jgi:hypothetical protein